MPHLHTEDGQHDTTVSALIMRSFDGVPKLLLHMHKKHAMLLQPGGHVELNENPWQAVCHEIQEETGYDISQLKVLQPRERLKDLPTVALHPVPSAVNTHSIDNAGVEHFHTDSAYTFVAFDDPAHSLGDDESQDLRWLSMAEINELTDSDIYPDTREICRFGLETCYPNWEQISPNEFKL